MLLGFSDLRQISRLGAPACECSLVAIENPRPCGKWLCLCLILFPGKKVFALSFFMEGSFCAKRRVNSSLSSIGAGKIRYIENRCVRGQCNSVHEGC